MAITSSVALFIALAGGLNGLSHGADPGPPSWSSLAERGRDLYYGARAFERAPQVGTASLPTGNSACVSCHGAHGSGGRENLLAATDIRVQALRRRGSDGETVLMAMTDGVGVGGRTLSVGMPRYDPSADERAALLAYWPWLGEDAQPVRGVRATELLLGVQLDGLLSSEARDQVRAGLTSVLQRTNSSGGVHGRQLRLVTVDDAGADVFALVGSAPSASLASSLRRLRLPSLAALGLEAEDRVFDDWSVPLLPSRLAQARGAVRWLADSPPGCMRWLYDPQGWVGRDDATSVVRTASPPTAAGRKLCVAALAPAAEVDRLRSVSEAAGTPWAMLVELAWLRAGPLDVPGLSHHLVLPTPNAVSAEATRHGQSLWFVLGQVAARSVVEALARTGRTLQPEAVLEKFRGLAGFEPLAGAALSYSRGQSHGWTPQRWSREATASPIRAVGGGVP